MNLAIIVLWGITVWHRNLSAALILLADRASLASISNIRVPYSSNFSEIRFSLNLLRRTAEALLPLTNWLRGLEFAMVSFRIVSVTWKGLLNFPQPQNLSWYARLKLGWTWYLTIYNAYLLNKPLIRAEAAGVTYVDAIRFHKLTHRFCGYPGGWKSCLVVWGGVLDRKRPRWDGFYVLKKHE